jgi:hypothetical protein
LNNLLLIRFSILILAISVTLLVSQTAFARTPTPVPNRTPTPVSARATPVPERTPTPISLFIEEKITVGDGSTPSGEVIDESIGVTDEVITSGEVIEEFIGVTDEVITSGEVIAESITVTDTVETQLSASPNPTAVPAKKQPGAESKSVESSIKSTVTPIAAAAGKENKSPFSQGTGSANEEEPAESGSCNSVSGYEGLALMSVLLIPGVLKYRRRKE